MTQSTENLEDLKLIDRGNQTLGRVSEAESVQGVSL
jgi:hypothetical protein